MLKPDRFIQFPLTHPCFDTSHQVNLRDDAGMTYAIEADDDVRYLDGRIAEWPFGVTPSGEKRGLPLSRVPRFARTLCQGSTLLLRRGAGFASNA